jgi:hypothetical protein
MEEFLRALLPRCLPAGSTFSVHPFQGKGDLLKNLGSRLRAYAGAALGPSRIVVLVDRDNDNCAQLKRRLEAIAANSGFPTRTRAGARWRVANRIAIEELEAWYFGDWQAVRVVYPKATLSNKERHRDPDAIAGGTWELFERVLQRGGYFKGGIRKLELARRIGVSFEPRRCLSTSFRNFYEVIMEAVA